MTKSITGKKNIAEPEWSWEWIFGPKNSLRNKQRDEMVNYYMKWTYKFGLKHGLVLGIKD